MAGERRVEDAGWFHGLQFISGVFSLAGRTLYALVTPPLTWRHELVDEIWRMTRLCIIPLALSSFFYVFAPVALQVGQILTLVGAEDRLSAVIATGGLREFGPFVTAVVLAGVIGTATCADLGARKVREELDAMQVIGVDPVRKLVAPRFLALLIVVPLMTLPALEFNMIAGLVTAGTFLHLDPAVYLSTYGVGAVTLTEIIAALVKSTLYGALIASIFCYAGLTVRGGAEGVGRAVNQSVVVAFVAIFVFDFTYNATLLALFPELQSIR